MRFCIPILEDRGLLSPLSPHFGAAPMFLIVDGATLATHSVPNPADGAGPRCEVPAALAAHEVDAFIVGGIGDHALEEIGRTAARIYRAGKGRVADALAEQIAGRLPVVREGTRGPGWQVG
jgi:predicted Fe-Mo cluster-binding NifX family protein